MVIWKSCQLASAREPSWRAFLCVFGRESVITGLILPQNRLRERGNPVIAEFGKTRFGCRVYEMAKQIAPPTATTKACSDYQQG